MRVATYEATVENGQIKFSEAVRPPEHAKVYVVVTGVEVEEVVEVKEVTRVHIWSPHLAQRERAGDFAMEVTEEPQDAGLR